MKDPLPAITLRDPKTEKLASLSDEQGVRSLLVQMVERLSKADDGQKLPGDTTERVVVQILRKAGDLGRALAIIKEAETLAAIFQGTDLEKEAAALPKSKKSETQVGLLGDEALEKLCEDLVEAMTLLWPTFRDSIEKAEGQEAKKAVVGIGFVPETDDAEAYIRVVAETKVSTRELTRTSKVRRLKSGRHQLELFQSARL